MTTDNNDPDIILSSDIWYPEEEEATRTEETVETVDKSAFVVYDGDANVIGVFDTDEGAWNFVQFHNPDQWLYDEFILNEPFKWPKSR